MFENSSPDKLEVIQRWIYADPGSAYALAARGTHYVSAAYVARGDKFANATPQKNFDRMSDLAMKARVDLEESLRRNPRLIAAYNGLLQIAQLTSDRELFKASVEGALALDPADHSIYTYWMNAVEPKWGGSLSMMEQVVKTALSHANDNPLLSRVAARPLCYQAEMTDCAECGDGVRHDERALELYRKAAALGPAQCFLDNAANVAARTGDVEAAVRYYSQSYRFSGPGSNLIWRAWSLQKLGRADWALEDVAVVLKERPRDTEALNMQGWILLSSHRPKEAEQAYLKTLNVNPSEREALSELVNLYTGDLHEREKAQKIVDKMMADNPRNARAWLLQSVLHKGVDESKCEETLEKYLALVDNDPRDSYEQHDITRAKTRLAELKANASH